MECQDNSECPNNFNCCKDKCYTHNICKRKAVDKQEDYSFCPNLDDAECSVTPAYRLTRFFECNKNQKCAVGHKCCPSKCFGHNICVNPITKQTELIKQETNESREEVDDPIEGMEGYILKECPKEDKCTKMHSMRLLLPLKCETANDCSTNEMCCYNICANFNTCMSKYDVETINKHIEEGILDLSNIPMDLELEY